MKLSVDGARQWELLQVVKELFCSCLACYDYPACPKDSLQRSRHQTFFQCDISMILQHIQADSELSSEPFDKCIESLNELLQEFENTIDDGILKGGTDSQEIEACESLEIQYPKLEIIKEKLSETEEHQSAIDYLSPYIHLTGVQDYKVLIGAMKIFNEEMKQVYKFSSSSESEALHTNVNRGLATKPTSQSTQPDSLVEAVHPVRNMIEQLHGSLIRSLGCRSSHNARLHLPAQDGTNSTKCDPGPGLNVDIYFSTCSGKSGWQGAKCTVKSPSNTCDKSCKEVQNLCYTIGRSQKRKRQLKLLSIGENLLHDLPNCRERLETSQSPSKSLRELLDEDHFSRFGRQKVSLKEKRILAVVLAHLMLQLCDGPWIRETWDASNIYFPYNPTTSKANLRQPYADSSLSPKKRTAGSASEGLESNNIDPFHKYPLILDFARLLVEIELGETIQPTKEDGEGPDTVFYMVCRVFDEMAENIHDGYKSAIEACLECDEFLPADTSFDHAEFRDLVYQNIVTPLEQELLTGFRITVPELSSLQYEDGRSSQKSTSSSFGALAGWEQDNSPGTTDSRNDHSQDPNHAPRSASFEVNSSTREYPIVNGRNGISQVRVDTFSSSVSSSVEIYPPESFKIAIVCPTAVELAPIVAMLDTEYKEISFTPQLQRNSYTLGRIGYHNVVVTAMHGIGNNYAAAVVTQLTNDFKSVQFGLLVGMGGGIPNLPQDDIRLGDVVVSKPTKEFGGAVQFDRGKTHPDSRFERTGHLNKPSWFLRSNLEKLIAKHLTQPSRVGEYLAEMTRKRSLMVQKGYVHPGEEYDVLYEHDYRHKPDTNDCKDCDQNKKVERERRTSKDPVVHYGTIGSANTVLKDGDTREKLRKDLGVICVDMETAGIIDDLPCLIIRGISDYADSHKTKKWQPYAAAAAAAFAKEFLSIIPPDFSAAST
ncbi:hypothetical protein TWF481_012263 [Arthrobotrys musiformis]|uniref:Nucleoside phosphorylase domain-containing protein n=1 Tax=Arthrobotrys musiformis TaxID=47236 RepID=A0AAV9W2L6_9PEZI